MYLQKKTLHKQWVKKKITQTENTTSPPPTPRAHLSYGPPLMAMDTDTLFWKQTRISYQVYALRFKGALFFTVIFCAPSTGI